MYISTHNNMQACFKNSSVREELESMVTQYWCPKTMFLMVWHRVTSLTFGTRILKQMKSALDTHLLIEFEPESVSHPCQDFLVACACADNVYYE